MPAELPLLCPAKLDIFAPICTAVSALDSWRNGNWYGKVHFGVVQGMLRGCQGKSMNGMGCPGNDATRATHSAAQRPCARRCPASGRGAYDA